MGFQIHDLGIASSVFLGLYVLYNINSFYIVSKRGWRSVYTLLLIYGVIRIGGQISGLGYAIKGFVHYQWLIAYLVLSAEGYFTLVLSTLYFLINEQQAFYGSSVLKKKLVGGLSYKDIFHISLIPANAIIISGGCMLTGMTTEQLATDTSKVNTSKALRTVGQAFFLVNSLSVASLTIYNFAKGLRTKTMVLLIIIIPFITIRGIYGVLAIYIDAMNYFILDNYFSATAHKKLTIYEYVLAISMEFITGFILLNVFWLKKFIVNEPDCEQRPLTQGKDDVTKTESHDSDSQQPSTDTHVWDHLLVVKLFRYIKSKVT